MIKDSAIGFGIADAAKNHEHDPYAAVVNPEHGYAGLSVELEPRVLPGNSRRRGFHVILFDPLELRGRESA